MSASMVRLGVAAECWLGGVPVVRNAQAFRKKK